MFNQTKGDRERILDHAIDTITERLTRKIPFDRIELERTDDTEKMSFILINLSLLEILITKEGVDYVLASVAGEVDSPILITQDISGIVTQDNKLIEVQ